MTWEQIESKWKHLAGSFHLKFGAVTNDETETVPGNKDHLSVALQKKYGHSKAEAETHLEEWRQSLGEDDNIPTSTSGAPTY